MRIAHDVLARYLDLPEDPRALRELLDDCGLEVKRVEQGPDQPAIFTLELLANRGDHHCYEGVATELNGRLGVGVRRPAVAELQTGPSPWPVHCDTPLCGVYTATLLERTGEGALDPAEARVLEAAGIHALSVPVDATNLVNLELGQPTHAFDADTLQGPIRVHLSRAGETALPLFATERVALPEGTLVIADDAKILAIAGVIGCEESKTTASTTRLLLESAHFDPVAVRKASRALGIQTDSSARFERGSDPARALTGAARVVHLLEGAGWRRTGPTGVVGDWSDPGRVLPLDLALARRFLQVELDVERAAELLGRYGFGTEPAGPDRLAVRVPTHRLWDVAFAADLYEELAKAIGYNQTPIALPPVDLGAVPAPWEERKRAAEEVWIGQGFYEVFTDGFYGRQVREDLGLTEAHPLWAHVGTTNAIERNYALLKNNTLAQALDCVATNLRMRHPEVRAYEWTRTFHPRPEDEEAARGPRGEGWSPCVERKVLWAVALGSDRPPSWAGGARPADVHFLAGILEELGVALGLEIRLDPAGSDHPVWDRLHPGRRAAVLCEGRPIGLVGEVHPTLIRAWKLKRARPVFVELEADPLLHHPPRRPDFVEPPDWHPIVRALAFGLPARFEAGRVAELLRREGPDWLIEVRIADRFATDQGGAAITYQLVFANPPQARRRAEAVNAVCEELAAAVLGQLGAEGVVQR